MEFRGGAARIGEAEHEDETEALRAMGLAVPGDLDVLDFAEAVEEFEEVAFGGVVGEIPDVEAGRLDGIDIQRRRCGILTTGLTRGVRGRGLRWRRWCRPVAARGWGCGLRREDAEGQPAEKAAEE